jgi:hypothetical protein
MPSSSKPSAGHWKKALFFPPILDRTSGKKKLHSKGCRGERRGHGIASDTGTDAIGSPQGSEVVIDREKATNFFHLCMGL